MGSYCRHLLLTGAYSQLTDVAVGLVYMHEHGMIHGDLKGVRPLAPDRESVSNGNYKGEYSHRRYLPCSPGGLWLAHDHIRSRKSHGILEFIHAGRHASMDEPRTLRPGSVRPRTQPPDEAFGLLRAWNGCIRSLE